MKQRTTCATGEVSLHQQRGVQGVSCRKVPLVDDHHTGTARVEHSRIHAGGSGIEPALCQQAELLARGILECHLIYIGGSGQSLHRTGPLPEQFSAPARDRA
jgi:hypothetical protein